MIRDLEALKRLIAALIRHNSSSSRISGPWRIWSHTIS
jgi:hypothetical protein